MYAIHTNNGDCSSCDALFDRYPRFNKYLRAWFKKLQAMYPSAHISVAGRGKLAQQKALKEKSSLADWTESAHNWNCAIDIFRLLDNGKADWTPSWYKTTIGPMVADDLELVWYGDDKAKFKEQGHVEVKGWKQLVANGIEYLVESA